MPSPPEASSASNAILPADLIAIVMDFSQYSDVRKSLLASKLMTRKVSTLIREIQIMKPNEMKPQVKTKERFPNVRVVNIFCLFTTTNDEEDSSLYNDHKFHPTVAACVVPFLSAFPELKSSFIGGYENHKRIPYSYYDYRYRHFFTSRDHTRHIESLLVALCGALQMGMLPANLDLQGIVADSIYPSYASFDCKISGRNTSSTIDESEPQPCLCRFVHKHFFLQNLVWVNGTYERRDDQKYCISWEDQIDIMSKRDDSKEFFTSGKPFLVLLRDGFYYENNEYTGFIHDYEEMDKVYREIERLGICAWAGRYHLEHEAMERIQVLIEKFGCDPRTLSQEHVTIALMRGGDGCMNPLPKSTKNLSGRLMIDKIDYDKLSSWGFDIDQNVFVAVSDEELQNLFDDAHKKRSCD